MTVKEIIDFCCASVRDVDAETKDYARMALKNRYETLFNAHNWREAMSETVETTNYRGVITLPQEVGEITFVSVLNKDGTVNNLEYRERGWLEKFGDGGGAGGNAGKPWSYFRTENCGYPINDPSYLTIHSEWQEPVPVKVYIKGVNAYDVIVEERKLIEGKIKLKTDHFFKYVMNFNKQESAYPFIISDDEGRSISMEAGAKSMQFVQIIIWNAKAGVDVRVGYKKSPDVLGDDMATPMVSNLLDALRAFTAAELYRRQGKLSMYDAMVREAVAMVEAAKNIERNQSEEYVQAVPIIYGVDPGKVFS